MLSEAELHDVARPIGVIARSHQHSRRQPSCAFDRLEAMTQSDLDLVASDVRHLRRHPQLNGKPRVGCDGEQGEDGNLVNDAMFVPPRIMD